MAISGDDRLAIHELMGLYGHVIDERRWADFPDVFTDDLHYEATDFDMATSRSLAELIELWQGPTAGHPVAHHATNIVVSEDPDGTVRVLSKGIGVGRKGRVGSVVYRDVVVKGADGRWRIGKRMVSLRRPPA